MSDRLNLLVLCTSGTPPTDLEAHLPSSRYRSEHRVLNSHQDARALLCDGEWDAVLLDGEATMARLNGVLSAPDRCRAQRPIVLIRSAPSPADAPRPRGISAVLERVELSRLAHAIEVAVREARGLALGMAAYRHLLDGIDDAVLILSPEGIILTANPAATRLLALSGDALAGRPLRALTVFEADAHSHLDAALAASTEASPAELDLVVSGRDRQRRLRLRLIPSLYMNEPALIAIAQDLHERQAADERKRVEYEQQTTLRTLLELTLSDRPLPETLRACLDELLALSWLAREPRGGIFLMDAADPALRLTVARDLAPEIETLCARVPLGHCHCGRAAATGRIQHVAHVDDTHDNRYPDMPDHGHFSLPLKSGTRTFGVLVLYLPPGFDCEEPKAQFLASVADILAGYLSRKQDEERLRQAAAVFDSTHEGVIVTGLDGRIEAVNPAFTTITGYSPEEILGKRPSVLQSGHHDAAFYRTLWESIEASGFWQSEIWNRHKDGNVFPEWLTISAVRDQHARITNYVGVFSDISRLKNAEQRLSHQAHHDALTGLPNRVLLETLLEHGLERTRRAGDLLAVLFMDLDRFKHVNDSLGHAAGDELLRIAAKRLQERLRASDTIARLGGDEFILLLESLHDSKHAADVAQSLIELFQAPIRLSGGHEVYVGASIGISIFPDDGASPDELVRNADTAMYQAKEGGRNTYRFYTESMTERAAQRLRLESRLRQALNNGGMVLHYQPLIANDRCIGVEALLRWLDAEDGMVPPRDFIPLAEETGLIVPLGEWVLRTACRQMKTWMDAGIVMETVAVNISPIQFQQPDFADQVRAILEQTGLPPMYLELEITESAIMAHGHRAEEKLGDLHELGVRLAIDDFGTGYSSLAYLKRFPISKLKIDQSFVRDLPGNLASTEIANTIIAMGRSLKMEILAEGVEKSEQLEYLKLQECDTFQGYLLSEPVPPEKIPTLLEKEFD